MLSYRHAFHAGNPADVLKHGVLSFVLAYLTRKDKPLSLVDTHAGAGHYDLSGEMARKTGEAQAGVMRLLEAAGPVPELFGGYLDAVRESLTGGPGYPGSCALMARVMRPQDRLTLFELHSTDHEALARGLGGTQKIRVLREDGLAGLVAAVPPPERRGLVLIDPSYEVKTDYESVPETLIRAHRRFATGVYVMWYPVVDRQRTEAMIERLEGARIGKLFRIELAMAPDTQERGMTASGLLIVNPPYTLPEAASAGLAWLADALGAEGESFARWVRE